MPNSLFKARTGFTLIELLIVISIIILLVGMAVPAFLSVNNGSAMRNAERQIQSANMLARQQAVSSRKKVRFCVPYQIVKANNYIRTNMLYNSYFLYSEETSGVATPSSILGKIQTLPQGILFDNTTIDSWTKNASLLDVDFITVLSKFRYFRYGSSGGIYFLDAQNAGVANYNIVLRPGVLNANGVPQYKTGTWTTQQVNVITGRCTLLQ
jgi:prepilin-type N-terminal cleavage/methylation domain-containing protein